MKDQKISPAVTAYMFASICISELHLVEMFIITVAAIAYLAQAECSVGLSDECISTIILFPVPRGTVAESDNRSCKHTGSVEVGL